MGGRVKSGHGFPSLFVPHGAPTLALEENETVEFLKQLGAQLAHPTDEHLLPLFAAAGGVGAAASAGPARGRSPHRGWTPGSLSVASYSFDAGQ